MIAWQYQAYDEANPASTCEACPWHDALAITGL